MEYCSPEQGRLNHTRLLMQCKDETYAKNCVKKDPIWKGQNFVLYWQCTEVLDGCKPYLEEKGTEVWKSDGHSAFLAYPSSQDHCNKDH